jgi:hypothetical protein
MLSLRMLSGQSPLSLDSEHFEHLVEMVDHHCHGSASGWLIVFDQSVEVGGGLV